MQPKEILSLRRFRGSEKRWVRHYTETGYKRTQRSYQLLAMSCSSTSWLPLSKAHGIKYHEQNWKGKICLLKAGWSLFCVSFCILQKMCYAEIFRLHQRPFNGFLGVQCHKQYWRVGGSSRPLSVSSVTLRSIKTSKGFLKGGREERI